MCDVVRVLSDSLTVFISLHLQSEFNKAAFVLCLCILVLDYFSSFDRLIQAQWGKKKETCSPTIGYCLCFSAETQIT